MTGSRLSHLRDFYALLARLEPVCGGSSRLSICNGRMQWPARGVYFFYEPNEKRRDTGDGLRVVRVGTHALSSSSKTTLWNRLAQHRGNASDRGGNHRGSIFRLLVGSALMARDEIAISSWGQGSNASRDIRLQEIEIERAVSNVIGAMSVVWLEISDEPGPTSARGVIERNAIALLSNYGKAPLDPPSPEWLGRLSDRERVRSSGLWNSNHVEESFDPVFFHVFEAKLAEMGRRQ